jgi:hypothetical protein
MGAYRSTCAQENKRLLHAHAIAMQGMRRRSIHAWHTSKLFARAYKHTSMYRSIAPLYLCMIRTIEFR